MKKCVNCGRELPDEANFCPYCESDQSEPAKSKAPRVWKRKTLTLTVAAILIAAALFTIWFVTRPRSYEAQSAELKYKDYRIMLRFGGFPEDGKYGQPEREVTIRAKQGYANPSCLYAVGTDDSDLSAEFSELLESASVATVPRGDAAQMEHDDPHDAPDFQGSVLAANVFFDTECGTNDIIWTLNMKNGDVIKISHALIIHEQPTASYYPSDAPMDTIEELQSLLDKIEAEVDPATVVSIYLPPVVYEGGITMGTRAYTLFGDSDGSTMTAFTGPVIIESAAPVISEIYGVRFEGSGKGTGLMASAGVVVYDCVFTGWETGARAAEGSWIATHGCTFENNKIGYQFSSNDSKIKSPNFDNTSFIENGIGLHLVAVPDGMALQMQNCTFEKNQTDILNDAGVDIDLSEAVMK